MEETTKRERLFCSQYLRCRNVREAAHLAALPGGEAEGYALLEKQSVRRRLKSEKAPSLSALAQAGLCRMAFGSNADAIALALCEPEQALSRLENWDLFGVSGVKRLKDGSLEVQLSDRFAALKLLSELGREQEQAEDGLSFCRALEDCAKREGA